jgi:hypothetical protein
MSHIYQLSFQGEKKLLSNCKYIIDTVIIMNRKKGSNTISSIIFLNCILPLFPLMYLSESRENQHVVYRG